MMSFPWKRESSVFGLPAAACPSMIEAGAGMTAFFGSGNFEIVSGNVNIKQILCPAFAVRAGKTGPENNMDLQRKQYFGRQDRLGKEISNVGTYYIYIFYYAELYKKETVIKKKDS